MIITYHILFWLSYMTLGGLMDFARNPKYFSINVLDMFFTQLPNMVVFYACLAIYNEFVKPLKVFFLVISILCIYGLSLSLWLLNTHIISALVHANKIRSSKIPFNWIRFCIEVLWLFVIYAFFAFGYYYLRKSVRHEKRLRIIEKEKHHAEYAFLRAQINPHFLNNTLNFFYSKSLPLSSELADGIMTLSEIMHYSLKQDREDETTLIEEEIAHIRNVININQLRFNHELQVNFEVHGRTTNARIIPLILITIVENVLKHGNCTNESNPAKIILNISEEEGYVQLRTYNTKKKGPKELSSGIGMKNIRKRLSHHYGKDYHLSIQETETDYTLEMILYHTYHNKATAYNTIDHPPFISASTY
jgi:two-component system, LytTR family, sensor kinase